MTHSGSDEFADSTGADGLCAAGLSSWDFLQELDFALDTNRNSLLPQKQPKQTANASSEVLKEKNRQAQKRARQKKKVCDLRSVVIKPAHSAEADADNYFTGEVRIG